MSPFWKRIIRAWDLPGLTPLAPWKMTTLLYLHYKRKFTLAGKNGLEKVPRGIIVVCSYKETDRTPQ